MRWILRTAVRGSGTEALASRERDPVQKIRSCKSPATGALQLRCTQNAFAAGNVDTLRAGAKYGPGPCGRTRYDQRPPDFHRLAAQHRVSTGKWIESANLAMHFCNISAPVDR